MMDATKVGRLPTALVIGVAKAATTWLYACAEEHPDIFVPENKEVDFFSKYYYKGFRWYADKFSGVDGEEEILDISPSYFIDPGAASRIRAWDQDVQLILILRNPIERAYSHYCMHLRAGVVSPKIDDELCASSRLLQEGLYMKHLKNYLKEIDQDKINIFIFDDLKKDTKAFLTDVFCTLGVNEHFQPSLLESKHHARKARPQSRLVHESARGDYNFLLSVGGSTVSKYLKRMRRSKAASFFHKINRGSDFPELHDDKIKEMVDFYREDVEKISEFMGRDLEREWLYKFVG
jgi:hypothetical protein